MSTEDELLAAAPEILGPTFVRPDDMPEAPVEEEPEGPDDVSSFDRRYRDPFIGLLYLGKLESSPIIYGHKFKLVTPSQAVRLESGPLHKQYLNTMSSEIAWATMVVASYLQSVDGSPLPEPMGPNDSGLQQRFDWITENMYDKVIIKVFEQCLILDSQVSDTLDELEKSGKA